MEYPKPRIGYYQAECCLLDLYKIETPEELLAIEERITNNDECGPLMIFVTLAEAITYLGDDLPPDECAEQFKRLGWNVA